MSETGFQRTTVFMRWTEAFSVGIPSIDMQHKKLIGLINDFYQGFDQGLASDRLVKLIKGLRDYTVYHFSYEERLFTMYGFPQSQGHKKEHDDFIQKVDSFYEKFTSGKLLLSLEVTNFLRTWIDHHIKGTDKCYSKYLIARGVQ